MSGQQPKSQPSFGRESTRGDWFYPVDGRSVSVSGNATDGPEARNVTLECKDGVCPVPWVTIPSRPEMKPDMVNHPPHYVDGGIECIEAIEAQLTAEEFRGYLKGNCAKYLWRERHKGGIESLKKNKWYLERLIIFDAANQNG